MPTSNADPSATALADAAVTGPEETAGGTREELLPVPPVVALENLESGETAVAPIGTSPNFPPGTLNSALDAPNQVQDADLETLRRLLFARESALLESLQKRLDDPHTHAREVGEVLAEALLLRSRKDDRLAKALEPTVEDILKTALRKNPLDFAGVLFPLMGPAIRRSIAEAFRSMLESLSKSLEMSFSWKGLRWRWEALRSGKSFSEVVLLNTLVYRVEQVFFIHAETGLVLAHAVNEGIAGQDADLVSGMLTAIQDFVRDCFTGGGGDLDSIRLGDFTIYMEKSPQAFLACAVRGTPPPDFRAGIQVNFEIMLMECADALASFNGDTAPFFSIHRRLEDCLAAHFAGEDKHLPLWVKALPVAVVLALAAGLGWWRWGVAREVESLAASRLFIQTQQAIAHGQMLRGVEVLRREPGILPVLVGRDVQKPWGISILRDDFARDPAAVLAENGFAPGDFVLSVTPYASFEPEVITRRVEDKIKPPSSVRMIFENGVLTLTGTAPMEWILLTRQEVSALPGIRSVDISGLSDPRSEQLSALVREVEAVKIEFPLGGDMPIPADQPVLTKAVEDLVELEKLAGEMGIAAGVTIYGHADSSGSLKRNYELSQSRAKTLAAMLYAKGSGLPVSTYGMGADYAEKNPSSTTGDQADRRIELRVHLTRAPDATGDVLGR